MKTTIALLGVFAAFAVVLLVLTNRVGSRNKRDAQYLRDLDSWVKLHESELESYTDAIITGRIAKKKNLVTFQPPELSKSRFGITGATTDANTNVYLILQGSHVMFNVGIIKRHGEAALLGDGSEPQLTRTNHLHGDWWYYSSQ
jgi:hypothetical protein